MTDTAPASTNDAWIVAATIWAEARGEGAIGMRWVGEVIKNRVAANKPAFGVGWTGVCTKMEQFSCWNLTSPEYKKLTPAYLAALPAGSPDGQAWSTARNIAAQIMVGALADPTNGATYYCTTAVKPAWETDKVRVAMIGHHLFFRDKAVAPSTNTK